MITSYTMLTNSVILLFIIDKFYRFGKESAMFMILLILLLFKINV